MMGCSGTKCVMPSVPSTTQYGRVAGLIAGQSRPAPSDDRPWLENAQQRPRGGIDESSSVARDGAPLQVAGELHLAKGRAVVRRETPRPLAGPLRETQLLEELEPPDHGHPQLSSLDRGRHRIVEGNGAIGAYPALERGVEETVVPRDDGALESQRMVPRTAQSQRPGRRVLAPLADAVGDVVSREKERSAVRISAPDDHVQVRLGRVVVVDRHPLEPRPEVALHRRHEVAGVLAEVHAVTVLGRDDELPQAPVARALPRGERARKVDLVPARVESEAWPARLLGALACEVPAMRAPGSRASVRDEPGLHDAALERGRGRADEAFPRGRGARTGEPADRAPHATGRGLRVGTTQPTRPNPHRELVAVAAHVAPIRAVGRQLIRGSTPRSATATAARSRQKSRVHRAFAQLHRTLEVFITAIVHATCVAARFRLQLHARVTHSGEGSGALHASPGSLRLQVRIGAEDSSAPSGVYLAVPDRAPAPFRVAPSAASWRP